MGTSRGEKQAVELLADKIEVVGTCPDDYPLQKKEHSDEFLREWGHLRSRTSSFGAVMRLRHLAARGLTDFLHKQDFIHVHTPIIVSGDCEGAGELFRVTDANPEKQKEPFFGQEAFLTVSGQLHAEAFANGLSRVYAFGPTFRAESHSKTTTHLAEFWMLEPEMAFADLSSLMDLAEGTVKSGMQCLLQDGASDLHTVGKLASLDGMQSLVQKDFGRISYSEAVDVLQRAPKTFVHPVEWGMDLQREHERYLCEEFTGGVPLFVAGYPMHIKPFYAKRSAKDERCADAVDLLVPGIGELIGGSVREDRYDQLIQTMTDRKMNLEQYSWYLDLRKFGSGQTAGFGLGFERFVQWMSGVPNIRDVSPCPRTAGSIKL